jgi:hypothetical protein
MIAGTARMSVMVDARVSRATAKRLRASSLSWVVLVLPLRITAP